MSTYVGFLTSGIHGAICATLALAFPSIVIIVLVAKCMEQFKNSPIVAAVFKALRPASTGLILAASLSVAQLAFFKGEWSGFSPDWKFSGDHQSSGDCTCSSFVCFHEKV